MDIFKVKKYVPMGLLCLFVGKVILFGTDYSDMGVAIALVAYSALVDYLEKHKKLQDIEHIVNKQNEVISKMALEIDSLKTSIVGVKMGQNFKKVI
jgi:hypothetical protein